MSGTLLLLLRRTICLGVCLFSMASATKGLAQITFLNSAETGQKHRKKPSQQQTQPLLPAPQLPLAPSTNSSSENLQAWQGLRIAEIRFQGVPADSLDPLPVTLPLKVGDSLDTEKVRQSLRQLYSTGLYQKIQIQGVRSGDSVNIAFAGEPRLFIGSVTVSGVKSDRLTAYLIRATRLNAGVKFSEDSLNEADGHLQRGLQENGFYQAEVYRKVSLDANQQINVAYTVVLGKQARVGDVTVEGDSGMSLPSFRKKGKLKEGNKVDRETTGRALSSLRKSYQKKGRLQANINLQSNNYQKTRNHLDYDFHANQGPIVKVLVDGAPLSKNKLKRMIPVYEEGAVDEDLLNEGDRNLRDYYQRAGYFDVKVEHLQEQPEADRTTITFHVTLGPLHKVESVKISGNKYFEADTLEEHFSVHKADFLDHHGLFSQSLVSSDVESIKALYQSNGFTSVKVDPVIQDSDADSQNKKGIATVRIEYKIEEGSQQRIGSIQLTGAKAIPVTDLQALLNSQSGQPYSPVALAGDRDAVLTYYLSKGFTKAQVDVHQAPDSKDENAVNVTMRIVEGDQSFVQSILISGAHYTKPSTIRRELALHPGDPLNESALLETQRRLYDLTLFNEVNTAIQNPTGQQERKKVLLQLTEARRWDLSYGFGFEAQTGNPQRNCNYQQYQDILNQQNLTGTSCSENGKTGASPRVLFDITRSNLGGREQSLTLRTTYGLLEQRANLIYQAPRVFGGQNYGLTISGGYNNSQDITTYSSSRIEASMRVTRHFYNPDSWLSKANTFVYEFAYRRVKAFNVNISPDQIPLLSRSVKVGGPGFTWIRDTRDAPLDAHHGSYTSFQEFLSTAKFGSEANFNRLDMTNSTYYTYGRRQWVFARSTRFGYERSFGEHLQIPLPERLYAGGGTSHRGFAMNAAGPRDPETGYPVGGAGAFINSLELRPPAPQLPLVGNSVGFVLFHDMGNVFRRSSDIWSSLLRIDQPHSETCKDLSNTVQGQNTSTGQEGPCSFNYASHATGLGLRYRTPIGPVRVDFSYNLNPPIYPVIVDLSNLQSTKHVGRADHFNFFFSLGQSF